MFFPWDSHVVLSFTWTHTVPPLSTQSTSCVPQCSENRPEKLQHFGQLDFFLRVNQVWFDVPVLWERLLEYQGEGLEIFLAFPAHICSCQNLGHVTAEIKWPKSFWILLGVPLYSRPSSNAAVSGLLSFLVTLFYSFAFILSVILLFV